MFVIHDGRAHQTFVELRETEGSLTVVARGLAAGDVVIAQPTDAITDGRRVRG